MPNQGVQYGRSYARVSGARRWATRHEHKYKNILRHDPQQVRRESAGYTMLLSIAWCIEPIVLDSPPRIGLHDSCDLFACCQ
jgi:hypothetical protein